MRAYGRRRFLALALGLVAGAAGCTSQPAPRSTQVAARSTVTPSPTPSEPPITPSKARAAFAAYVATDDRVRGAGDLSWALDTVTGGRHDLTKAEYESTGGEPRRPAWGEPTVLVPRLAAGDRNPWFSVVVERDGTPAILTFVRAGEDWRLSSAAALARDRRLPAVKLDADGYAEPLASGDQSVAISPKFMAPLHATIAEAGPQGIAAGLIAPGPFTTEVAEQIAEDRERWKGTGYDYDSIFSTGELPVYALRTEDGGALVQYSLSRQTTITPVTDSAASTPIGVPKAAQWAVGRSYVSVAQLEPLKVFEMHQYATAVPPAGASQPAVVVAHDGAVTRATAPG
ncbi:hypothetical protein [Thermoactinospora rubra]|uniref:hypothetical protein n=1 Tax=Thermoactinospora rubra TaxID=1088767 RepID=UPI000A10920E|nr:hypothetical protein [Thermoactinospora rubra]